MSELPCPTCSYDLRVHVSRDGAQCPECGGTFFADDLALPTGLWNGYMGPFLKRWKWLLLAAIVMPSVTLVAMMWVGFIRWYGSWPLWYEVLRVMVIAVTPIMHQAVAIACGRAMRCPWPWWGGVSAGLLLSAASTITYYALFWLIVLFLLWGS